MMIPNSYKSFEEIDKQLKIISLQKKIYKEYLKQDLKCAKSSFSSTALKGGFKHVLQEQLLNFIVNYWNKKFK